MLRQYPLRVIVNLAKRDGFKSAGSLQPKREAANARKQVQNLEHQATPATKGWGGAVTTPTPPRQATSGEGVARITPHHPTVQRIVCAR